MSHARSERITGGRVFSGFRAVAKSSVRLEIVRLRRLLAQSVETASRYEMLLREGDHRIKNSLQIVASLVHLQARREKSAPVCDALQAAAARIDSIARIHDALQGGDGEDLLDLGKVLETMCLSLQAMAGDTLGVRVVVNTETIQAPMAFAQPVVLAVNELVVNSLRHAFLGNRTGTIQITATQADGELRLVVSDNGVGLPADYETGQGYGLRLVGAMTRQIGGVLHIENKAGALFSITAPMTT